MDAKEKIITGLKLALTIQKIISVNVSKNDLSLVTSLRKLAASSGTEYSIIQKISSAKKDPQFTTIAAIIDGFGISFSQFASVFDSITESEIDEFKRNVAIKRKKKDSNKSTSLKKESAKRKKRK